MPIDSAEKRRSAGGVGFWVVGPGVTPNVAKDAEWRQQAGWGYSGIPITPPVPGVAMREKFTLGTKESLSVTGDPVIGGPWSW